MFNTKPVKLVYLYFLFTYLTYIKAQNLKLNNLKFSFIFSNLLNITSRIFVLLASMYSISIVERNSHSCNYRIILKESNNTCSPFTITQICCDAGPHCSVIGVLSARLNAKHLRHKYHSNVCFSGSCQHYLIDCLFFVVFICASDIELNLIPQSPPNRPPTPHKKKRF